MANPEKQYLTKTKHDELTKELEYLRVTKRKEVAEQLDYAKQLGDLSENAEYHEARDEQAKLEDRIANLDALLKSANIVDAHHTESVTVGSIVELIRQGKTDSIKYTIVGSEEADMTKGKLSSTSPLGAALRAKKKGDSVVVETPSGKVSYKIIDIA